MRICFFGDSFVNGTGDPAFLGWAGRSCLAARHAGIDITYYNLGIRRDTSEDILRRWHTEAVARLPGDIDGRLIFSFAVNDCVVDGGLQRVTYEATLANARTVFEQATRWKTTLMVGPPPIADADLNQRVRRLSAGLGSLCGEIAVPYLDTFQTLVNDERWMRDVAAYDGAHPGAAGYALFGEIVQRWPAWQAWPSYP
jgi:lysophospholipase L1-like esterase